MNKILILTSLFSTVLLIACGNDPEVISSSDTSDKPRQSTGIFDNPTMESGGTQPNTIPNTDMHKVVVKEVLPTEKYVYLHVAEGEETFWIATRNQSVTVGATYFYKGGLLKTNFESKEYDRIFDKVYLVSNIVPANHGDENAQEMRNTPPSSKPVTSPKEKNANRNIVHDGSIRIGDLVANASKYAGKTVQITGECVKINYNIMGRNWIHLKDGSRDDFDMVITSDVQIPEGHVVTMQGTVSLDKDFGAGYRYEIILEKGQVVHD